MLFPSKRWDYFPCEEIEIFKFLIKNLIISWYLQWQLIAKESTWARSPLNSKNCLFFTFLVCHEAGIWNIDKICHNMCWSSPFCIGFGKYNSKETCDIYFEFQSDTRTMKLMFCSPLNPLQPFLYHLLLDRGNRTKAANMSECFWSYNVTKLLPWN